MSGILTFLAGLLTPLFTNFSIEAEVRGQSVNLTITNTGLATMHIVDICIVNHDKTHMNCIIGGSQAKVSWSNSFVLPKSLTRDEPCSCRINLPMMLLPTGGEYNFYISVANSRKKIKYSKLLTYR